MALEAAGIDRSMVALIYSLHRQLQTPDGRRPAGARASASQSPCAWAPLGRKPSGDNRALDQGCTSAARTSFGAKYARLRAPWIARTTAFSRGIAACCSTAWHPQGTEQKERHLAHSLSARLRWLRGPDLNRRPSGYEPDELPGCSTPHQNCSRCKGPLALYVEPISSFRPKFEGVHYR